MEPLKSILKIYIPNFIKYKKSLGYKYNNIEHLYLIDKIFYSNNIKNFNDTDKILDVIKKDKQAKKYKNEIMDLIDFCNIINNKKEKKKILNLRLKSYTKKLPYIITEDEFIKFCNYLDKKSKYDKKTYQHIFPVLFRLLYSTGMRINEVISLKLNDIDLKNNKISIVHSKNNKSRIIIISNSMKNIIKEYLIFSSPKIYLFECKNQKISYHLVSNYLKKILRETGMHFTLHDFRHSMATNTFSKLLKEGYDEKIVLYYLHLYLGHNSIEETEYYLYFNKSIKDNMRLKYEK